MLEKFNLVSKKTIPNTIVFALTTSGKQKAEQYGGTAKDKVLVSLDENGSSNIKEICENTGMSRATVETCVRILQRGGYIHSVKGEDA